MPGSLLRLPSPAPLSHPRTLRLLLKPHLLSFLTQHASIFMTILNFEVLKIEAHNLCRDATTTPLVGCPPSPPEQNHSFFAPHLLVYMYTVECEPNENPLSPASPRRHGYEQVGAFCNLLLREPCPPRMQPLPLLWHIARSGKVQHTETIIPYP